MLRRRVKEILDFVELSAFRHRPMGSLSFAQQKLAEFARALALEPKVLLLAEPLRSDRTFRKRQAVDPACSIARRHPLQLHLPVFANNLCRRAQRARAQIPLMRSITAIRRVLCLAFGLENRSICGVPGSLMFRRLPFDDLVRMQLELLTKLSHGAIFSQSRQCYPRFEFRVVFAASWCATLIS